MRAALALGLAVALVGSAQWKVRDLKSPPGGKQPIPVAIDDRGDVLVSDPFANRGALWRKGRWILLPRSSDVRAINGNGTVVGAYRRDAFRWRNGRLTRLHVGGQAAEAVAINERGQIAGNVYRKQSPGAFLWTNGKLTELHPLAGTASVATGVSDHGAVIGYVTLPTGSQRGFVWRGGSATDLGTLPSAAFDPSIDQYVQPTAINDRGDVAGIVHNEVGGYSRWFLWRDGRMVTHATGYAEESVLGLTASGHVLIQGNTGDSDGIGASFLWRGGKLTRLPTLGGPRTYATALNDKDQIAGMSFVAAKRLRPFVWQNGRMIAVSTPAKRYSPPWPSVNAINARGDVVGYDYTNSGQHVLIWRRG